MKNIFKKIVAINLITVIMLMNFNFLGLNKIIATAEDGEFTSNEWKYNIKIKKVVAYNFSRTDSNSHGYMLDEEGRLWETQYGGGLKQIFTTHRFSDIASGYDHMLALDEEGYLWGWGDNTYYQLGNGTTEASTEPIAIYATKQFESVACGNDTSFAIDKTGNLYAWGTNEFGQTIKTDTIDIESESLNKTITIEVATTPQLKLSNIKKISAHGASMLAIDKDGYAWGWGMNEYGQLGNYNTAEIKTKTYYSKPTGGEPASKYEYEYVETPSKVSETIKFRDVIIGVQNSYGISGHSVLLTEDGKAYTVGNNYWGQLGDGTKVDKKTLTIPTGLEDIKIISILAGSIWSAFMDENHNIWTCGSNSKGSLGNGTTNDSGTVVKVLKDKEVTFTDFATDSAHNSIYVFDSNGDLWGWGGNYYELGCGGYEKQTTPIQITENIKQYTVNFKNGDTIEKTETVEKGQSATAPELTKAGYTLSWDTDFSNITSDLEVNAVWTANTNTPYKVEHYVRNLDTEVEGYTLKETEDKEGTTDTTVTAEYKEYEGFTKNEEYVEKVESGNISGDGSLVLKLYYNRNVYNINYELNGGQETGSLANSYTYGKEMILPNRVEKQGYTFAGWYDNESLAGNPVTTIPNTSIGDKTFYAKWDAKGDTAYKVEHYKQKQDLSGYELAETENKTGVTGATVNAIAKIYVGYTENTAHEERIDTGTIAANGSLTLKLYYDRSEFTVTFKNGDTVEKTETVEKGQSATAPELTKAGYTLSWDTDFSNITSDLEVNAVWTANTNTPYKVEHYVRNLDTEVEGYTLKETEDKEGTTDTTVTAEYKEYEGFTKNEEYVEKVESGNISGDGSLVLKLYYNRNVYNINYELNGGQETGSLANSYTYGKEMILPNRVEKQGYTFAGWYDNESLAGNPVTTIPNTSIGDKTFYAKWDAKGDTAYKVEHYKQKQDLSGYELAETENKTGVTGATVNAIAKIYVGYTENTAHEERIDTGTIAANGSLTLKLYYDRSEFTVTFKNGDTVEKTETVEKGQSATAPELTKAGYTLSWDTDFSNITSDLEVNAVWTANTNTPYKVEHYVRNLDTEVEGYTLKETEDKEGTTDTTVTAEYKEYEGFTKNEEYVEKVESGNISGDGSLVLKLYYNRNVYNINYELNGGQETGSLANSYTYGKEMILPNRVEKQGYTFAGWYDNENLTGSPITTIPSTEIGDKTFYAKWDAKGDTVYKVQHYKQKQDLSGYELAEEETKTGVTGAVVNAIPKTYSGYTQNTEHSERKAQGTILADGSLTLKLYYDRNQFTITFKDGQTIQKTEQVEKGQGATAPELTKAGYSLSWDTDFSNITSDLEVNAVWTANTNTPYKVEHYVRNLDTEVEGYTLKETEDKEGTTDTTVTAEYKEYEGFTKNEEYVGRVESGNVSGDGTLVLKLYYSRNSYNITYELNGGTATGNLANSYIYGKEMVLQNKVVKEGYIFAGWYENNEFTGNPVTTISATTIGEKTYYAKWVEKDEDYYILSTKYNIDMELNIITKVKPDTNIEIFLSNIGTNGECKVLNAKREEVSTNTLVGTGYILQVTYKGKIYEYQIAVRGDIDGNGTITVTDLSMMNQALTKKIILTGIKQKAADIDYTGEITVTDLSMVNQALTKRITL